MKSRLDIYGLLMFSIEKMAWHLRQYYCFWKAINGKVYFLITEWFLITTAEK
jgi:hypothetical protein